MSEINHTIFAELPGEYSISRVISDGTVFNGSASFTLLKPDTLDYAEKGQSTLPSGAIIDSYRDFQYRFENDLIEMLFKDSHRYFEKYVTLNFTPQPECFYAADTHLCGKDTYKHSMFWHGKNKFETKTEISGPEKDMLISSIYERC